MNAILHNRPAESSISYTEFSVYPTIILYATVLTVLLFYRQGYVEMNILQLLRDKIIKDFPAISEEELQRRLQLAEKLLENLKT